VSASVFCCLKGRFSGKNTQNNEKSDRKIKNKFSIEIRNNSR